MTWNNPNPLANPLNTRRYGNFNVGCQENNFYINTNHSGNPKDLQPPNQDVPMYGTPEWNEKYGVQSNLEVPNQDIPPGDMLSRNGFLPGQSDLFRLSDGTIINFKTGKILSQNIQSSQYWGNPNKTISFGMQQAYESPRREFEQLIARATASGEPLQSIYSPTTLDQLEALEGPLDQKSIEYWLKAEEEADKLRSSMNKEQLDAIDQFEKHFPKSRLIEESKKAREIK